MESVPFPISDNVCVCVCVCVKDGWDQSVALEAGVLASSGSGLG